MNLDDRNVQVRLSEGSLNLRVRRLYRNQNFEIDTPKSRALDRSSWETTESMPIPTLSKRT